MYLDCHVELAGAETSCVGLAGLLDLDCWTSGAELARGSNGPALLKLAGAVLLGWVYWPAGAGLLEMACLAFLSLGSWCAGAGWTGGSEVLACWSWPGQLVRWGRGLAAANCWGCCTAGAGCRG